MGISYPLVNGNRFSFASIELSMAAGGRFIGFTAINYSDNLERGEVRGAHPMILGRTREDYKAEADAELFKSEAQLFLEYLGEGYMEKEFDVVVCYQEFDTASIPLVVDILKSCSIKKIEDAHTQGTEGLKMKLELNPLYILRNGKTPISKLLIDQLGEAARSAFNK